MDGELRKEVIEMVKVGRTTVSCPKCKSEQVWRKGLTPHRGAPKPRYVCTKCGTTFYFKKTAPAEKEVTETGEK